MMPADAEPRCQRALLTPLISRLLPRYAAAATPRQLMPALFYEAYAG